MIRSQKVSLVAAVALSASALLAGSGGGVFAQSPAPSAVAGLPTTPTGLTELDKALGADQPYAGKSVDIQTQWTGGEGANFQTALAAFQKATGITVTVEEIGKSHETILRTRIEGGDPTLDLAVLAQPSGVVAYGKEGKLIDVSTFIDPAVLKANYPATLDLVSDGGKVWGLPYKLDVKSVVWYPIKAFAAAGYTVPTTWQEMLDLSAKIVADGKGNPWCIGMEAGTATGWQATDWVEEVMLRTVGLDKYNQWIAGTLKFDSPEVKAAMAEVAKIFFTKDFVYGGNTAIVATDQKTTMDPMFNQDLAAPKCWMQQIPTWYGPDFFPDQRASGQPSKYIVGEDVGLFYLPPIDPKLGNPVEGSGDTLMVLQDRPEVRAVAEFLSTPAGIQTWIQAGSAISANVNTPADWYKDHYKLQVAADIVKNATAFGFDASDLMPPAVGGGTFWTEMVKWIQDNGANTEDRLKAIDASWPAK